jgi:hypothetical protein
LTTYVVDGADAVVAAGTVGAETDGAGTGVEAPAGMTSVSPGRITLVTVIELARSNAESRTPNRAAIPERLSPDFTVAVVAAVAGAGAGAAWAIAPPIGRAIRSAVDVARTSRVVRVTPSPSVALDRTLTHS